ncbi:MAG: FAD-binding protein [Chthonomonas sp.]|nr:FAD-binding protein [Chthonomonas sp.]
MTWQQEVAQLLGGDAVLAGPIAERAYDADAYTVDRSQPTLVVLPSSTDQVVELIRICARHGVPFTTRGAGTGLSGGATPALGGLVISTKRLNKISEIEVGERMLRAGAGVVNVAITQAVAQAGLHFAPDPSSQSVATLGGNIGENSGGPHTLKYGVTAAHILGLTLVDDHGDVHEFAPHRNPPWPDFAQAVIGSEGTVGVVTEAWCNLEPSAPYVQTGLISFASVRQATDFISAVIADGVVPAALEMMDRNILFALREAFGLSYPAGTEALLLVEFDGDDAQAVQSTMQAVAQLASRFEAIAVEMATNEDERKKLWTARKKGVGAMGRLAPSIVTHDGVIPRSRLPEMLELVYQVAEERGIGVANIFHAGDGNLHPCFYFDDRDPEQVRAVVEAGEIILRKCVELGGSLTGEHGIGFEKSDLLGLQFSDDDLALQRDIQAIFCGSSNSNPCKVLPLGKGCSEHRSRWRGSAW